MTAGNSWFGRHRVAIASTVVVVLGAGALAGYALGSTGYPVRHVSLNDGGIWVTNDDGGLFGRVNKPAGALDAGFAAPGGAVTSAQLDISQDGAAVVARDESGGKLYPVDVNRAQALENGGIPVAATAQVGLAGGTLAILDPATGKLWVSHVDQDTSLTSLSTVDPSSAPIATVGGPAALAVGGDGTAYAVAASGKVATVPPAASASSAVTYTDLGAHLKQVQATAVGDRVVALDPTTGQLVLPGGRVVTGVADGAVLQQPGPAADAVLVATRSGLASYALADGAPSTLYTQGTGQPAAPVVLTGCVHAAWGGSPGRYARSCAGGTLTTVPLAAEQSLVSPVFRQNRGSIVLNDLHDGAVWDLDTAKRLDNWQSVTPQAIAQKSDKNNDNQTKAANNKPPKAEPDDLGARPGRTTILHVLDNDSDPAGRILAVSSATGSSDPRAKLSVAPDGQTVEIALPASFPGVSVVTFKYTVDDGVKGLNASADVTVHVRTPDEDEPPKLRAVAAAPTWSVASGGELSLPVLDDWRDYDGDAVVLSKASTSAGSVTTTSDGRVSLKAPAQAGTVKVTYEVSDGIAPAVSVSYLVTVLAPDSTTLVRPVAEPDVASGQVGRPILIHPLANDLPGVDPTETDAVLGIAGTVASPAGTQVTTTAATGTVTVKASLPGSYQLTYAASFGNAPFATGKIRVDVNPAPTTVQEPIAMPDSAVLRGQSPVIVDVLANDVDPAGGVLDVQSAAPVTPNELQVAIIQGHWLRISASSAVLTPNPQLVRYTMTNGIAAPVTGEVSVTQLAPISPDTPVTETDHAVVRAGDAVTIPVLDNDSTPGGDPITLAANVAGAPARGELVVSPPGDGRAYVSGNTVRYVPPAAVAAQQTVTITYVAQDPALDSANGQAVVTVVPAPTPQTPDQAPTPVDIQARVTAGDRTTVVVPTSGVDPDGDSVTVVGIVSAPTRGRIIGMGAASFTYEAFPSADNGGSDSVGYEVTDRYGKTGTATVYLTVVQPVASQPPVAVDSTLVAAPNSVVNANLLSNVLKADDDAVTVSLLEGSASATLDAATGALRVTSPANGRTLVVRFAATDGLATSTASLTVRSVAGWNAPPVASDAFARVVSPTATSVSVDLAKDMADPDSATEPTVVAVSGARSVTGTTAVLPVGAQPYVVVYTVRDAGGATAAGLIHVPGAGAGAPFATPGKTITISKAGGSTTVDVSQYVTDPAGKRVILTLKNLISGAPLTGITAVFGDATHIKISGVGSYSGPAAATFQVTDGASASDPAGNTALITVPVQVGPATPVLRCPSSPFTLVEGGDPVTVNVATVCHVWVADRSTLGSLRFTAVAKHAVAGVTIGGAGSGSISLSAGTDAKPGTAGSITVGVAGSNAVPAILDFGVVAASPPSISPVVVDGVKAGSSATVDIAQYVQSSLRSPEISVVRVTPTGAGGASTSVAGARVTIAVGGQTKGTLTYALVATDVADHARTDRQVTGTITVHVLGLPDAPTGVQVGRTVLSESVQLSWTAPANNGAPITSYDVAYSGGTQSCPASPCTITHLHNGTAYTFTVRAINAVGPGAVSAPSASATPDALPGQVPLPAATVSGSASTSPTSGQLTLTWAANTPDTGTPINGYQVSGPGSIRSVSGTSTTFTGLTNGVTYTFKVRAGNSAPGRWGPWSTPASAVPYGTPSAPGAPTVSHAQPADSSTDFTAAWSAPPNNGNGSAIASYTVIEYRQGQQVVSRTVSGATSATFAGVGDSGDAYTYAVSVTNAHGLTSALSPQSAPITAIGQPGPVQDISLRDYNPSSGEGLDGAMTVDFDLGVVNGTAIRRVSYTVSNGGPSSFWTYDAQQGTHETETIAGLQNGTTYTVSLTETNADVNGENSQTSDAAQSMNSATPYGPISAGSASVSASGCSGSSSSATWSWSGGSGNGRPAEYEVTIDGSTFDGGPVPNGGSTTRSYGCNPPASHSMTVSVTRSVNGANDSAISNTASFTEPPPPPPPPPPPSVTVSKGTPCSSVAGGCAGCSSSSCAFIYVQTANFSAGVSCNFDSDHGNGGFAQQVPYGANDGKNSPNYYGYPGTYVYVTCSNGSQSASGNLKW